VRVRAIESAEWFIEQQQARVGGESSGDANALTLATGKLVRKPVGEFRRFEADEIEHFI